ncbi:Leucine-rich repeat-containing protein 15 [Holothuria leucospilota]|uniref:Leucine-rich repeat-containing protein 15 n=1 Tax=Holothuria leucospilota TaxID=206669 RepID=A0A9Q1BYH0_HOLLE|nr:Leucine-rich repeat-containing protein 15 [Holothuria leucospilota]
MIFYRDLEENKIRSFPLDIFQPLKNLGILQLTGNVIKLLPSGSFWGLSKLDTLLLNRNKIAEVHDGTFENNTVMSILDISCNSIERFFPETFRGLTNLIQLELSFNRILGVPDGLFYSLNNLRNLYLSRNNLSKIPKDIFNDVNLGEVLYLFQNNLTKIDGDPFGGSPVSEIHLYGNEIETISEKALLRLKNDSLLKCVSPSSLPSVILETYAVFIFREFATGGFNCFTSGECVPCEKGTFGDRKTAGCHTCPKGGFYQDEVGQRSSHPGGMSCKACNDGTYVKDGHGQSIQDCEVCPEGTNQTIAAGLRACFCKTGYSRTDRYGPCSICLEEDGLDCSHDFKLLRPGYFWSWDFPSANLSNYRKFVQNLQKEERNLSSYVKYIEQIPRVFPCQRSKSCPNNNDIIEGQCADGYKGWLCSNCQSEYYSVLNTCVPCPRKEILILEIGLFLSVCVFVCYLFSWQIRKDANRHSKQRSLVDIVISRVKILLGFYQVVGEIFSSLHEINWTGPLVLIGTFISSLELNILRIFVRPRCLSEKLVMNPQTEFIIGVSCPIVIIVLPFVLYQTRKLYLKCKSLIYHVPYFRAHLYNFKLRLYTCVIVLMFLTYPPICSVIFELYPKACKTFYLDKDGNHSVTRLRSDLDVDCEGLIVYHYFAYFFTGSYVIAFPTLLLFLLWKYCSGTDRTRVNVHSINSMESDSSTTEEQSLIENVTTYSSRSVPVWLNFLRENYKDQFWFWEIIELSRKVTQTLLITLFGWEDRLTVLLTTCISVLFLLLHARYRPMKSSYEQRLQMLSLTVIFINVVIASNEVPSTYDDAVTIILILLNILMLLIIAGMW